MHCAISAGVMSLTLLAEVGAGVPAYKQYPASTIK
jgi:hypothetical protein